MVFAANNSHSGGDLCDEGTLQVNSSTNAIGAGAIQVGSGASLELNGNFNWRPVA
jgi:hypothetical protein